MVRNSTKKAASGAAISPTQQQLAPIAATTATVSPAISSFPQIQHQQQSRQRSPAATMTTTTTTTTSSISIGQPPVKVAVAPTVTNSADGRFKSFTCPNCSKLVMLDQDKSPDDHTCLLQQPIRLRKRLRGPPPYRYSNEEASVALPPAKKRGKKPVSALDKLKGPDPEKEAWLQREVVPKVYDPKDLWCRYCGCVQASGFSRGPWGSRKLCTIHYVQWQTKKTLDLSKWPKEPLEPINRMENTEYDYLKRMQAKGARYDSE